MPSEINVFTEFVDFLEAHQILNSDDVENALSFLDGLEGVISERTFILGYEGLARYLNKKLSLVELKEFAKNHVEILAKDGAARYFFAQALMEKKGLSETERVELIYLMPRTYQPFLLRRFVGS